MTTKSPEVPIPKGVPRTVICSVCGIDWDRHDRKHITRCIELLKADLEALKTETERLKKENDNLRRPNWWWKYYTYTTPTIFTKITYSISTTMALPKTSTYTINAYWTSSTGRWHNASTDNQGEEQAS